MKKSSHLITLLLLLLLFLFSGCSEGSEVTDDIPQDNALTEDEITLLEFEGFWYRPEDYDAEGVSLVDIFYVDSAFETWEPYTIYGSTGDFNPCHVDDGNLVLIHPFFGELVLFYDGDVLYDDLGQTQFIRGEPLEPISLNFDGKWYVNGNSNSNYLEITGNSYLIYSTFYDEIRKEGTYTASEMEYFTHGKDSVFATVLSLEDPQDVFGGEDLVPIFNNTVLFNDFDWEYYVNESITGTPEGDTAIKYMHLLTHFWRGDSTPTTILSFPFHGAIYATTFTDTGMAEGTNNIGSWSADGNGIIITLDDGTTETVTFDGDTMYIDYFGMTFESYR